jgi:hypothetical protein
MFTIISILFLFLISIFSILLFYQLKKIRHYKLNSGNCPVCGVTTKSFKDENTGSLFTVEAVKQRVLSNNRCSGIVEIEYKCNNCGLKEVHNSVK